MAHLATKVPALHTHFGNQIEQKVNNLGIYLGSSEKSSTFARHNVGCVGILHWAQTRHIGIRNIAYHLGRTPY